MRYRIAWCLAVVIVIVAYVVSGVKASDATAHSIVAKLGVGIQEAVDGEYEDREIEVTSLNNVFLSRRDKEVINEVIKSLADNEYFEVADTVYKTRLEFSGLSVTLHLDAKYKDLKVSEHLGLEMPDGMGDAEFWEYVTGRVQDEYTYKTSGKIDLQTVLEDKSGQCYSFAEMLYVVGKEHGRDVRMAVNSVHAWNVAKINGEEKEVDVTYGMAR